MSDRQKREIAKFYNSISTGYDEMTNFQSRILKNTQLIKKYIEKYNIKTMLDTGCATGFYAIAFSLNNVNSIGIDVSKDMIKQAKLNAFKLKSNAKFIHTDFISFPSKINKKFDAIFCTGNTLAHILKKKKIVKIIRNFKNALNKNGIILIQLLNYDKILKEKNRIVNIRIKNNIQYIRFYDFLDKFIRFNILTINLKDTSSHKITSVYLYPWTKEELQKIFKELKFRNIKFYSNMKLDRYNKRTAENLVIIAKK